MCCLMLSSTIAFPKNTLPSNLEKLYHGTSVGASSPKALSHSLLSPSLKQFPGLKLQPLKRPPSLVQVQLARFILAKPQPDRYCDIAGSPVATRKWAEQTEETAEHVGASAGICLGHGPVAGWPTRLLGRYTTLQVLLWNWVRRDVARCCQVETNGGREAARQRLSRVDEH